MPKQFFLPICIWNRWRNILLLLRHYSLLTTNSSYNNTKVIEILFLYKHCGLLSRPIICVVKTMYVLSDHSFCYVRGDLFCMSWMIIFLYVLNVHSFCMSWMIILFVCPEWSFFLNVLNDHSFCMSWMIILFVCPERSFFL